MSTTSRWWHQPFRTHQTNLREIDAGLDVEQVLDHIQDIGADTWLLNTAGIVSFYPSRLAFQHPSPWLAERSSGDLIGDAVEAAHARGVRVLSRVDFSKVHADLAEQHPDWCFVSATGERQIYNGLWSTCPSAPYYQERSEEILGEILDTYPVDGFFFNWFNFSQRDYTGRNHGPCHCAHCQRRFDERYGRPLPTRADWDDPAYVKWLEYTRETLGDLAGRVRKLITGKNPDAALILAHDPDIAFYEANNAVDRPQPLWIYGTGEFLRTSRTAAPDKPVWVNSVMFIDMPYRFVPEQEGHLGLYFAQTIAHGGNPSAYLVGTPDRLPATSFDIVRDVFCFHRDNARFYTDVRSAAEVGVVSSVRSGERYGGPSGVDKVRGELRGVYRALVESHVPFDIVPDHLLVMDALDSTLRRYKALVLPNVAVLSDDQAKVLDRYVETGGGLVATYDTGGFDAAGALRPGIALRSLGAATVIDRREAPGAMRSAYLRVTDPGDLPGATEGDLVLLDRAYLYVEPRPDAVCSFGLVPPSRYGPPEKCYWDVETDHPGLLWHRHGSGRTAYIPWPIGGLYDDLGRPEHRDILVHALDEVGGGRQLSTDAPAHVEIVVSTQDDPHRTLVHLINYSGQRGRAFGPPLPIHDIQVELPGVATVAAATSLRRGMPLETSRTAAGAVTFTLPHLDLFDLVVLDHG
ncbi:beta-galactosidase trimerization domain-containing protein [Actinopolymorpha sp. B17G11]|uniref:beta-galactosidase trimerization domain-containing protein n=1 Tax=Actinopolymorpha sp. B17G11 TaxID=3160861 RepID=UPI0032E3F4BA